MCVFGRCAAARLGLKTVGRLTSFLGRGEHRHKLPVFNARALNSNLSPSFLYIIIEIILTLISLSLSFLYIAIAIIIMIGR